MNPIHKKIIFIITASLVTVYFLVQPLPILKSRRLDPENLPISASLQINVSCWKEILEHINHKPPQNESKINNSNTNTNIKGYDASLINSANSKFRNRLGYAISPEFEVTPKPWTEKLGQNDVSESENSVKAATGSGTGTGNIVTVPVVQKILVYYNSNSLGSSNETGDCPRNRNSFKCDYTLWEELKKQTATSFQETTKLFDAVLVYRDSSHKEPIVFEKIENNPKLIYFTMDPASAPLSKSWQMQIKPKVKGRSRDILASYWRGSDIYTPSVKWRYYDARVKSKVQDKNYALGRKKMAAIVVSSCNSKNNRMGLVEEVGEYIGYDIFGKCGKNDCQKVDCFLNIKQNYKFYLSFESSNCRDFITENLVTRAFNNDLLPIVYGAHPSDYKAILPAHSYIHIEDFESLEKLGEWLTILDKNDTLYNSYFAWKGTGEFTKWNFGCEMREICAYLHADLNTINAGDGPKEKESPISYFNSRDTYDFDVFNWSKDGSKLCLPTNQRYWSRE